MRGYEFHEFYCISCGNKNLDLPRKQSKRKEKFHRKKLFCFSCGKEVNMIECKTYTEVETFKQDFLSGKFIEEAKESELRCCK